MPRIPNRLFLSWLAKQTMATNQAGILTHASSAEVAFPNTQWLIDLASAFTAAALYGIFTRFPILLRERGT